MASPLTSWLQDTITTQLQLGHHWLCHTATKTQEGIKPDPHKHWAGLYEDNGSCLDIIDDVSHEQPSTVQIIKISPLTVSDGETYIQATDKHKRIVDYHLHSLISVRKYTIRYTPYGPPRDQLHLILHAVEWLGSQAAEVPGQSKSVQSCGQIKAILQQLRETRNQADRIFSNPLLNLGTDTMPQPMDVADDDSFVDTSLTSQLAFGTQVVHPVRPRRTDNDVEFVGIKRMEPILAGNTRREELRPAAPMQPQALLNLITRRQPQKIGRSGAAPFAQGQGDVLAETTASSSARHMEGPVAEPHGPKTINMQGRIRYGQHEVHDSISRTNEDDANGLLAPSHDYDNAATISPARENSPHILKEASNEHGSRLSHEIGTHTSESDWMMAWDFNHDSMRVAHDQQSLLLKPETWQKPQPGYRFPDANVPIRILVELSELNDDGNSGFRIDSDHDMDGGLSPVSEHEAELEQDLPTSEVSWSRSPSPEPPKGPSRLDQGLPPDSSFEANASARTPVAGKSDSAQPSQRPIEIESSDDKDVVNPPSSPPVIRNNDESDEEMDMEVAMPQGLGEDIPPTSSLQIDTEPITASGFARPESVVQVRETPYRKGKNGYSVSLTSAPSSAPNHTSSVESKDNSSVSIVYGTYNEPKLSAQGDDGSKAGDVKALLPEIKRHVQEQKRVRFPSIEVNDVSMADAPSKSSQIQDPGPKFMVPFMRSDDEDQDMQFLEPSPMSAQVPPQELSSSGENNALSSHKVSDPRAQIGIKVSTTSPPVLKRKLDNSPSKRSGHQSKRRELKVVGFGGISPLSQDPATTYRQQRKHSLQKFREVRSAEAGTALSSNPAQELHVHPPLLSANTKICNDKPPESTLAASLQKLDILLDPPVAVGMKAQQTHEAAPLGLSGLATSKSGTTRSATAGRDVPSSTGRDDEPKRIDGTQVSTSAQAQGSLTIFEMFKQAYPEYTGDTQHFIGQCKQIYKLDMEDKMVPKWQWDDYLIRNRTDYKSYALKCMDEGQDAQPYHRYYKDHIQDTIYRKGILENASTLYTALDELGSRPPPTEPAAERVVKHTRKSLPWQGQRNDLSGTKQASARDRRRISLPDGSRRNPGTFATSPAVSREAFHPRSTPSASRTGARESLKAVPTPIQRKTNGTRLAGTNTNTPDSNVRPGDQYADFVKAKQKMASWNGDTRTDASNPTWPDNLAIRRSIAQPRVVDVLSWKDTA